MNWQRRERNQSGRSREGAHGIELTGSERPIAAVGVRGNLPPSSKIPHKNKKVPRSSRRARLIMSLTSGTRLSSYQITGLIGVGGMGEVYRALMRT